MYVATARMIGLQTTLGRELPDLELVTDEQDRPVLAAPEHARVVARVLFLRTRGCDGDFDCVGDNISLDGLWWFVAGDAVCEAGAILNTTVAC